MGTGRLLCLFATLAALQTLPAQGGDDDGEYVWQTDSEVRPAGAVHVEPLTNLSRLMASEEENGSTVSREGTPARTTAPRSIGSTSNPSSIVPATPAVVRDRPTASAGAPKASALAGAPLRVATRMQTPSASGGTAAGAASPSPSDSSGATARGSATASPLHEEIRAAPPEPRATSPGPSKASQTMIGQPEEEGRLFASPSLQSRRIDFRGWLSQGYTWNPDEPADRFNGPVTFNDRADEYQLNQLYLIGERVTNTECRDADFGGRVDLLYGTDHRFAVARGLEDRWNEGQRFYGLAMPQLYGDLAVGKWLGRVGHFYAPLGYETVMAPDNFFYSHSYSHQYGEPFTFTGAMVMRAVNERLAVHGGFSRGWDQWEDNNDRLDYFTGVNWKSADAKTAVSFEVVLGNEQPYAGSMRTMYSFVVNQQLSQRLRYVFSHDLGHETDTPDAANGSDRATWYGFVNYLFYELNPRLSVGTRFEWFVDEDGARVVGLGDPKGSAWGDPLVAPAAPGVWNEFALGVNYRPCPNLLFRTEARWDWVKALDANLPLAPFDDFSDRSQFILGADAIVKF